MNCFADKVIAKNMQNIDNMYFFEFIMMHKIFCKFIKKKVIWTILLFVKKYYDRSLENGYDLWMK